MTKNNVLIITQTADNACVDTVIKYIRGLGGEVIRFDVDRYPLHAKLSSVFTNGQWRIILKDGMTHYDLENISSVWYRRSHHIGKGLKDLMEQSYFTAAIGELKRSFYGMIEGLNCFQMEKYSTYRRLDSKEEQLKIALKCGMGIPESCITNSPEELIAFIQQVKGPVITKMQSSFSLYQKDREQVVFTNEILSEHLKELEGLKYCPMTFQQKIEKALELRVTIVGDQLFAFSIDSQNKEHAKIDWRKEGVDLVDQWKPFHLPSHVKMQLLQFMDIYGLNYGAIDLILTPDDDYYFLELNPAGEYFWLDKLCSHAISKQIASVLMNNTYRRV